MIRSDPDQYVAQDRIELSTHPTVSGDGLEPRRVDLRAFAIRTGRGYEVTRVALSRYAPSVDSMFVNSSLGGGGKDTWVVA
jgi:carboxylate-amine ligase